jgi:hypothetical protein
MKLLSRFLFILLLLSFSRAAWADHHLVFVHEVIRVSSSSCAVELEIEASSQNGFESVDRVEINSTELSPFGAVANTIDNGGHVNTGDTILFASDSFVMQNGIQADIAFADGLCALFTSGANFEFIIDDPTFGGPNVTIDELTASSNFGGDNTAMTKSSGGTSPQFVDLTASSVDVTNNAGTKATVGNTGGGGGGMNSGSGGGCTLEKAPSRPQWGYLLALGLVLAVSALRRISC